MDCEKWLSEYLRENGTTHCDIVREEAKKKHFGKSEFKKARKSLGVKTFHQFDEFGDTGNHFWYLED